jgi:hypothetical protein
MKKYFEHGPYSVKHPRVKDHYFFIILSTGMGWEHVSITLRKVVNRKAKQVERCPTWEEMCFIKSVFWDDEETVVQYHPPKSEWISNHPYCLHLWKPLDEYLPRPTALMVGVDQKDFKKNKDKLVADYWADKIPNL